MGKDVAYMMMGKLANVFKSTAVGSYRPVQST
jgi:hypothetical protein